MLGQDHSKTEPLEYRSSKCSEFEWVLTLNVRYSSPTVFMGESNLANELTFKDFLLHPKV